MAEEQALDEKELNAVLDRLIQGSILARRLR